MKIKFLKKASYREARGFALVVALILMSFVFLLLVSFSTLLHLEVQLSIHAMNQSKARLNALYGALEALGTLQETAGHDQRISTRAEIFDQTPAQHNVPDDPGYPYAITGVNEPYWVGIWSTEAQGSNAPDPINEPAALKTGYHPQNPDSGDLGVLRWLVSALGANPLSHTRNPQTDVPLLVVNSDDPGDPRNIYLPLVTLTDTEGSGTGGYAWWISDEGLKGTVSLDNRAAREGDRLALMGAARGAPEFVVWGDANHDLSSLKSGSGGGLTYMRRLSEIPNFGSLEHLLSPGEGVDLKQLMRNQFHDLTYLSQGLLTDVREGGFRRNLSAAFSSDSEVMALTLKSGERKHGSLVFGHYDQDVPFSPLLASAARGSSSTLSDRRDPGGPPWEQLRDFYRLRPDPAGFAVRPQNNAGMGVHPVITIFQIYFHLTVFETDVSTEDDPEYVLRLMAFPAVALWNPYNFPLEDTHYSVYNVSTTNVTAGTRRYLWSAEMDDWDPDPNSKFDGYHGPPETSIRFNIQSAFEPGEVKLFLPPPAPEREAWSAEEGNWLVDANAVYTISNLSEPGYFYSDFPERFTGRKIGPGETVEVRLKRHTDANPSNESSRKAIILGLYGPLADMVKDGNSGNFLQGVTGFDHSGLPGTNENEFFEWEIYGSAIPVMDPATALPWATLVNDFGGDLTGPTIPHTGQSLHMRWMDNYLHAPYPAASGKSFPQGHPRFAILASFNPRAVRNGSSPAEQHANNQNWGDGRRNPLYYLSTETVTRAGNSVPSGWEVREGDWGGMYGEPMRVGYSDATTSFVTRNTLFELPTGPEYFQSIASLQHASLSPPQTRPSSVSIRNFFEFGSHTGLDFNINNLYPAFPIGNSVAPLAVSLDERARTSWRLGQGNVLYDWSYLLNDYLWDRYFFAEYDPAGNRYYNPRFLKLSGTPVYDLNDRDEAVESFSAEAAGIVVDGSFNVNSTSVDAWRVLLGGMVGATVDGTLYSERAPYLHMIEPAEGNADGDAIDSQEVYGGYRTLGAIEIESLARAIVEQVKKRGPFVSLAHFVNRVVEGTDFRSPKEASYLQGRERAVGALQAALERSIVNQHLSDPTNSLYYNNIQDLEQYYEEWEPLTGMGARVFGQPGYMTQADLLARIGSVLSVRSDTFVIRAYGEALNPVTREASARAWCEMTVQRTVEPVEGMDDYQRRFVIVGFRWLNENDL